MLKYAVLGDDMCITPSKGDSYLALMRSLGVSISNAKSIVNSHFVEFAKKLIDKRTNSLDAIIGPKLILKSIQNKYLRIQILNEAYTRGMITKADILNSLRTISSDCLDFGHYILFGPKGTIKRDANYALYSGLIGGLFQPSLSVPSTYNNTYEAFAQVIIKRHRANADKCYSDLMTLPSFIRERCNRSGPA